MKQLTRYTQYLLAAASVAWLATGCQEKEFSEDYDINWPVPKVASLSAVKDTIGKTLTITGEQFGKLSRVTIGDPETDAEVVSSTETQIQVRIPRTAKSGPVTVYTAYKKNGRSAEVFTPVYLDARVTSWPNRITRGQAFVIRGANLDMVTEVEVGGTKVAIPATPGAATDQLSVSTQGLTLEDKVVVKITKALAGVQNGTSPELTVENPTAFFVPEAPVVLFDFENGNNPFSVSEAGTTSGFNTSGAPKGRGQRYLTVAKTAAANWKYLGEIVSANAIDLSKFHKPALTFLVNTRGKQGYFQFELEQDGTKWGMHFTPAKSPFDYVMRTNGWTWVSVPLTQENLEKWGGSGTTYNPTGSIQTVKLGFSTGNGSGDWEINLDQVMITDGQVKPVFKVFDFESGSNPYSGNATSGFNLSGVTGIAGANYLTVRKDGVANWDWTGEANAAGPIDLSASANTYVNFWLNTNGKKGFFQLETVQGGIKWGASIDASDYFLATNEWKHYSIRLADLGWGKWGGTGTATALDPKGVLDYFKVGFSTGNVSGAYEVNIDDVYLSDGPMF